jgi:TolB protein
VLDPALYRHVPRPSGGAVPHADWRSIGADALVQIRMPMQDDRIDLEARLHDTASAKVVFAQRYGGTLGQLRRVAHHLADDLVRHYTGRPGVSLSRVAFVSEHGKGKEIYLMDYDGRNVRRLTTTDTINLSPAWSPGGGELAFVSWRGRQPGVYVMSAEGKLGVLRTVGGELSSAPDWSPDGKHLAYSSDVDGNTEIYVLDRSAGANRRLTHNGAIDTSPAFSPNGTARGRRRSTPWTPRD